MGLLGQKTNLLLLGKVRNLQNIKPVSSVIHSAKFSQQARETFESQIGEFGIIETGGVLMGHLKDGTLLIEKASDPGPNAIHDLTYFRADANYIDMYIDMEYANSRGQNYYLGEWHTHPQVEPEPSDIDYTSLFEIAESSKDFAVLLIIGAINFSNKNFLTQQIILLKYKEDRRYFKLENLI
jgi:integrative and conjugative element protein (TIGR02256 family)